MKNPRKLSQTARWTFVFTLFLFWAFSANATVYECTTKQAFQWRGGKLIPDKLMLRRVIEYDDESSIMQLAVKPGAFWPITMKVSKSDKDEVDASTQVIGKDNQYIGDVVLRIQFWDKAVGIKYSLYMNEGITVGPCAIKPPDDAPPAQILTPHNQFNPYQ